MNTDTERHVISKTLFPALVMAFSMIFLNATFLPIALPAMSKSLNIDSSLLFWVVNTYFITACTLLLLGGRLVRRYGPLRLFRVGVLLYVLGSLLAFSASHLPGLLFSRILCGMGGAFVSPATFSVIIHIYTESVRGKKIGTLIGMSSVALMIGPFLGGVLTELISWRALFLLNVLAGSLALILAARSKVGFTKHHEGFDTGGFLCFSLAIASLVYGITVLGAGFSWVGVFCMVVAVLLGLWLILFSKAKHPYFDCAFFKGHAFLLAISLVFFCQGILSVSFFWPIYFLTQGGLGSTPIQVGSMISFATLGIFIFSPIAGVYFDKRGIKKPLLLGWSFLVLSLIGIGLTAMHPNLWSYLVFFIFFGMGVAFVATPLGTLSQTGVEKSASGMRAGLYNTVRFFSGALGIALLSSLGDRIHKRLFFKFLPQGMELGKVSFQALSQSKITGTFFQKYGAHFDQKKLELINQAWSQAYQKSFCYLHLSLFAIALTILCVVVVCRKKAFITKFSK